MEVNKLPPRKTIYRLKVTLQETDPPVWRRIEVPGVITLHRLHLILQEVMGWSNYHLYRFQVGEQEYGQPNPDNEFYELHFKDSYRAKLDRLELGKGKIFLYEYDFGDGWTHELTVEDIVQAESGVPCPTCVSGERACPPEDCGGPHGYAELLSILCNPDHEQYREMMEWAGARFRPSFFDVKRVNRILHAMHIPSKSS